MMALESQDWNELIKFLQNAEEGVSALVAADSEKEMERPRRALVSFHSAAAMLGLGGLEKAGLELEKFLTDKVSPGATDSIAVLGFAVSSVIDQMRAFKNGSGVPEIDLNELLEILRPSETATCVSGGNELPLETMPETSGSMDEAGLESLEGGAEKPGFTNFIELVRSWGGELSVTPDGDSGGKFTITFTRSTDSLKEIEKLLSAPGLMAGPHRSAEDAGIKSLITKSKEFIEAFSSGDLVGAQTILLNMANQQCDSSGLYKEIGGLARGLHDSIRSFLSTLDPSLHEIVEDKIPDSGIRLEHILEMTEKAAITTLDLVEAMQERLSKEMEQLSGLRGLLGGLRAIGDSAGKKLDQGTQALDAMETIIGENRSDLDTIHLTQDYHDLSGQIIQKVTNLLKDMELKLVNLIRTFGVRTETFEQKESTELYGPAHASVENAVHSQDEVDSLLAEFGF
ncbi:MAG: protein phosphatase CheZ [Syntrophobacteraceae bacterium]|jgi:chemotaxis protein CheZ